VKGYWPSRKPTSSASRLPPSVAAYRAYLRCYVRRVLDGASFIGFVPVADPDRARAFYEGVLGLRVVEDTPFALVVDAHGTMLRVTPVADLTPQPFTVAGWDVPDVHATLRALAESGVVENRYPGLEQDDLGVWLAPSGDQVAWFADPDGNTLSLTTFARHPS
jgi:catechol 2,3-dioxygenase-like lactoylglutathione lyase family enzyme